MESGTASNKMTIGQFREFAGAVLRSLPDDLDPTTAQGLIENQESLRGALRGALVPDLGYLSPYFCVRCTHCGEALTANSSDELHARKQSHLARCH